LIPGRRWTLASLVAVAALGLAAPAAAEEAPKPQLTRAPRLVRFVNAPPPAALAARGQVDVILAIDVDPAGKVQAVAVVRSGGPEFDAAAVAAARQFVFEPGEAAGKPVPVRVTFRYRFRMAPASQPASRPASQPASAPAAGSQPASAGAGAAASQPAGTAPVAGRVLRKGDRVPFDGVSVIVDQGPQEAVTDEQGRFAFPAVPLGRHRLRLQGSSIVATYGVVEVKRGTRVEITLYVEQRERYETVVTGRRAVQEVAEQTLAIEEVRRIPGTQGDTLKAVQNLAGVARAPFGTGQLVVWGSAPGDTRTYVDGVYIPVLYHFAALRSTVSSEFVQSLSFMPGGYRVDHGRGLGGVIEVETRAPRTDGLHGFAQIDLLDGTIGLEGPLTRTLSFAAGVRRSWIDVFLPLFTTSDFQLSPVYYDYQARLRWRATPRDDVDVFVFGSDDVLKLVLKRPDPALSSAFDAHNYYHRGLVAWHHRFGPGASLTVTPAVGYDVPFQIGGTFGNTALALDVKSLTYSLRALLRWPLGRHVRLEAGLDFEGTRNPLAVTAPAAGQPREGEDPSSRGGFGGAFASDSFTLHVLSAAPFVAVPVTLLGQRLVIVPQLRYETFGFLGYRGTPDEFAHGYGALEPRLAVRYQVLKWLAPKASFGVYHQAPDYLAFSKYFGAPTIKPERALHYVAGADFQPTRTLSIEAQGFYKDQRDLIVHGESPADPVLVNAGRGRVYGFELMLRQQLHRNFFGWIAYTLSRAERRVYADSPWTRFQFDQPHILTMVGSYKLPRGYQVGLRFRLVSGNPYTPVVGSYFNANLGRYRALYGTAYSSRLDAFHQLDLRFDKTWTYNRWKLSVYLDIQNLYYAQPPEGLTYNYNYTQRAAITGLPILPVLGVRGDL
jgi:TonB family protein